MVAPSGCVRVTAVTGLPLPDHIPGGRIWATLDKVLILLVKGLFGVFRQN